MSVDYAAIFESVVPERVLECGVMPGSRTNVNVKVRTDRGSYAMRVPGEGTNAYIDRRSEMANIEDVASFPFTPDVVYADGETGILVTRFLEGARGLRVEEMVEGDALLGVCSILSELHTSSVTFGNMFDLEGGLTGYRAVFESGGFALPAEIAAALPRLDATMCELSARFAMPSVPSHGDPNANNFMVDGERMYLIDWEYSGMADPYFDLANLVMTDSLAPADEERVIRAYEVCSGIEVDARRWHLFKACLDYMWMYWHLIKLSEGQMVEYNEASWRRRLARSLGNMERVGF